MPRRRLVVVGPPRRRGPPLGALAVGAVAGAAVASGSQKPKSTSETIVHVHVDGGAQQHHQQGFYSPQVMASQPSNYQQSYPPPPQQLPSSIGYPVLGQPPSSQTMYQHSHTAAHPSSAQIQPTIPAFYGTDGYQPNMSANPPPTQAMPLLQPVTSYPPSLPSGFQAQTIPPPNTAYPPAPAP